MPRRLVPASSNGKTVNESEPHREPFDIDLEEALAELEHERNLRRAVNVWSQQVPVRYRQADWESLLCAEPAHDPDTIADLDAFCRDPGPFLTLMGSVGPGKTYAAVAVADRLVRERCWISSFMITSELLDELRPPNTEWRDVKRHAVSCHLLVLDDLVAGGGGLTEWEEKQIDGILAKRWNEMRPTIITTNLNPDGLLGSVGKRSYDRIKDGVTVAITGESRRG